MARRARPAPEDDRITVALDVRDPAALIALAEALGEIAADLYAEGKFSLTSGTDPETMAR